MPIIRWTILAGFLLFCIGILFFTYMNNDRIGFKLTLFGFALVLGGVVVGNWKASLLQDMRPYRSAYQTAIVGFCLAVAAIFLGEYFPTTGAVAMAAGIAAMFLGVFMQMWKRSKHDSERT